MKSIIKVADFLWNVGVAIGTLFVACLGMTILGTIIILLHKLLDQLQNL